MIPRLTRNSCMKWFYFRERDDEILSQQLSTRMESVPEASEQALL